MNEKMVTATVFTGLALTAVIFEVFGGQGLLYLYAVIVSVALIAHAEQARRMQAIRVPRHRQPGERHRRAKAERQW